MTYSIACEEERAENIMPVWHTFDKGTYHISHKRWKESRNKIIVIIRHLGRVKREIIRLRQENAKLKQTKG